ncbi:MAG: deoxyguanosinetriphosphate triphosphohydrolase [Clostridiales bacterium]|jgi:dGTPase|nr:deoxyguanosinetriphosphate triphosphohydrolase [Clostridiales bacterium]
MSTIYRINQEQREHQYLRPYASFSDAAERKAPEAKCDIRPEYQRDRDKIIHSKAFRRLKHKTQVFLATDGDHYRTRLTHTLEVSQIARTIARALELNEDLTEAIALGHDLGHTPFGHTGEHVLNKMHPGGFKHAEQSLKVVDSLEHGGLNLTYAVRDGIVNHTGSDVADTLEGKIIKFADRIAYINHDIDDAIRAGLITKSDLPDDLIAVLGATHSVRIDTLIKAIVDYSYAKPIVDMQPDIHKAMLALREFLFSEVYTKTNHQQDSFACEVIEHLYTHFLNNPNELPSYNGIKDRDINEAVKDYIAGMTDVYAVQKYKEIIKN